MLGMKIIYIKVFFGYLIVQVEAIRSINFWE
ncbi:MAG: hypothetical protein ACI8UX_000437 [Psychromonas sp.]